MCVGSEARGAGRCRAACVRWLVGGCSPWWQAVLFCKPLPALVRPCIGAVGQRVPCTGLHRYLCSAALAVAIALALTL